MGAAGRRPPAWRAYGAAAVAVAVCAVPVVVSLVLLWLPLLCCAVAVVRFRRVRKRRMAQRCGGGGGGDGGGWTQAVDAGDRLTLLQKYLEDQMELVGAGAGEFFHDPTPREA